MKRFVLFSLFIVVTAALVVHAAPQQNQNRQGRGIDVEKRMTQMQRRLNLTADQVDRIRPILQRENDRMRDLRSKNPNQNGSTDRSTVTNEMRQIRQDSMKQIESVLTPEQAAKLHKEKQRTGRNGRSRSS